MTRESFVSTSGAGRKMRRRVGSPFVTEREPLSCSRALERMCDNLSPARGRDDV
jgi:hypothetical protein